MSGLEIQKKPNGYWKDKDHCAHAASLCSSTKEFRYRFKAAYKQCLWNNWIEELCSHFEKNSAPRGFWKVKQNVLNAASSCSTLMEFRKKYSAAYQSSKKNGWFDEILSSLIVQRDVYKWSDEESIHNEALKCETRTEFSIKSPSAYQAAHRLGIIDKVCSHMPIKNSFNERGIYAFEFPDNHVYVGLTYNFSIRKRDHLTQDKSQVYRYIRSSKLTPVFKILHGYTEMYSAATLEGDYLREYVDSGWIPLNVQEPGNLGGSSAFYTKTRVIDYAYQCSSLSEFRKRYEQAYNAARKHRWLGIIKEILPPSVNQYGSFQNTYEEVIELANSCASYRELYLQRPSAISFAKRNGFLHEIKAILPPQIITPKKKLQYTYEDVLDIAISCSSYTEFQRKYAGVYAAALKKGWIEDVVEILPLRLRKPYTKGEILDLATSCSSYSVFLKKYKTPSNVARAKGWIDEVQQFFNQTPRTPSYTFEDVIRLAKECSSYEEFRNMYGPYNCAIRNNWLEAIQKFLPKSFHDVYTLESVLDIATKCKSYKDFTVHHTGAYNAALTNKWIEEVEKILPREVSKPYTREQVILLARGCSSYTEFQNKYRYAYKAACNKGWIEDVQKIIPSKIHDPYTKEEIVAIAKTCKTRIEFQKKYPSVYMSAIQKGWYKEIQDIIPRQKRLPYTEDEIFTLAKQCESYVEFRTKYRNAYKAAGKLKLLNKLKSLY